MKILNAIRRSIRRLHAKGRTDGEIAAAIGGDRRRVCQFRLRMGLLCVGGRMYGRRELKIMRLNYGTIPAYAIAAQIGRPVDSVYRAARRLGLARCIPRLEDRPGLIDRLRARHAEGWSDAEIGRELGVDRHHLRALRKRLGLLPNTWSQHLRDRARRKTAEQLRRAGLPNLGHLRVAAFKKYARDRGWPEDLKKRQVQILELLWQRGPVTREEIGAALGLRKIARRIGNGRISYWYPMHCNTPGHGADNSYTADLLRRGLIISLGRIVRNKPPGARTGQGRNTVLYSLPLNIERKPHAKEGR